MEILLSSKERVKAAQLKVKRDGSEGRFKYRERKQTGTGKEMTGFLHPRITLNRFVQAVIKKELAYTGIKSQQPHQGDTGSVRTGFDVVKRFRRMGGGVTTGITFRR